MTIDKTLANTTIEQLSHAFGVLQQGRSFGIRVIATPECLEGLKLADHPERDAVIANIAPSDRIKGIL